MIQTGSSFCKSDNVLASLFHYYNGEVYVCSSNYIIEFVNENFKNKFGDDCIGKTCYKLIFGNEDICPWCPRKNIDTFNNTISIDVINPKTGNWNEIQFIKIEDDFIVAIKDISNKKAIEYKLKAREDELLRKENILKKLTDKLKLTQFLLDSSSIITIWTDPLGSILDLNEKACNFLGYSKDEMLSTNFAFYDDYLDYTQWNNLWEEANNKGFVTRETYLKDKNGESKQVLINLNPLTIKNKSYCFFYIFDMSDINEKEKACGDDKNILELIVEKQTDRLKQILDDIREKEFELNLRNRELLRKRKILSSVNKIFLETLKCENIYQISNICLDEALTLSNSKSGFIIELKDNSMFEFLSFSNDINVNERVLKIDSPVLNKIIREKRSIIVNVPERYSYKFNLPYISPGITAFLGMPLFDDGNIVGIIVLLDNPNGYDYRDLESMKLFVLSYIEVINKRKKQDRIIEQNSKLLESKDEITKKNIILRDINSRLAEMNNNKRTFLYSLSHELRTPLNSIIGFGDLLMAEHYGRLSEKQNYYLKMILGNADYLQEIIDDLIDIARIDSKKFEIKLNKCSPKELLDETVMSIENSIISKNIKLKQKYNYIKGPLSLDKKRVKQVIINLLSNAVKFTPENGEIEVFLDTINDKKIRIGVKDSGIGIDENHLKKVFEDFYQVEKEGNTIYKGLGIGLALSKRIIEMMGGEIFVESKINQGSNFYFDLPIVKYVETKTEITNDNFDYYGVKPNKTVVVVDDNDSNLKLLENMLNIYGHKVYKAKNGKEAVDFVSKITPDLIFMDINMPIMDGIEATKKIKSIPVCKNIPIVSITADLSDHTSRQKDDADFDYHLTKPVRPKDILKVLTEFIN